MTRLPVLAVAVFGLSLLAARFVEAEEPPVEPRPVEEICRELEATIASMPAFAVDYTIRYDQDEEYYRSRGVPVPTFSLKEYRWWAADEKFFLWVDENRPGVAPYGYVFDGRAPYRVPSDAPIERSPLVFQNYAVAMKPTVQLGTELPTGKPTLLEALRSPAAEATGIEEVGGAPCYRFDIRRVEPDHNSPPLWVTAWLDPAKGMLPRRVMEVYDPVELDRLVAEGKRTTEIDGTVQETKFDAEMREKLRDLKFDWETEEFVRVPNSAAEDGESWFPKRAVYRQFGGRIFLEIGRIELRKEPADDWFEVAIPAGIR